MFSQLAFALLLGSSQASSRHGAIELSIPDDKLVPFDSQILDVASKISLINARLPGLNFISKLREKQVLESDRVALDDFVKYNMPELTEALSSNVNLRSKEVYRAVLHVARNYFHGLDLPMWKLIPREMRYGYVEFFACLPKIIKLMVLIRIGRLADDCKLDLRSYLTGRLISLFK